MREGSGCLQGHLCSPPTSPKAKPKALFSRLPGAADSCWWFCISGGLECGPPPWVGGAFHWQDLIYSHGDPRGSERCLRWLSPTLHLRRVCFALHPQISKRGHPARARLQRDAGAPTCSRPDGVSFWALLLRLSRSPASASQGLKLVYIVFHSNLSFIPRLKASKPDLPGGLKRVREGREEGRTWAARSRALCGLPTGINFQGWVEPGHIKITKEGHL